MKSVLFEHRCVHCDKLLFKGVLLSGSLEVRCTRCKTDNTISGVSSSIDTQGRYFLLFDYEGNILEASESATEALGYSREELLQMNRRDINTDLTGEEYQELRKVLMGGIGSVAFDTVHRKKDGSSIPVKLRVKIIQASGSPVALIIATPLSRREGQKEVLGMIPYELEINTTGKITYLNTALIVFLGYRVFSMIGRMMSDLFADDRLYEDVCMPLMKDSGFFQVERAPIKHADGTVTFMTLTFHPRTEKDESFIGYSISAVVSGKD